MGLLDDLRNEAERQRVLDQTQQAQEQQNDEVYRKQIRPRLKELFSFLQELCEHLNYIKKEIPIQYNFPCCDKTFSLHQAEYQVTTDSSDNMTSFRLRCNAVAPHPLILPALNEKEAFTWRDEVRQHGLNVTIRSNKHRHYNASHLVEILPRIPIVFDFRADISSQSVQLRIKNYQELGETRSVFSPADLTTEWMEDIGLLILREKDCITVHEWTEEELKKFQTSTGSSSKDKNSAFWERFKRSIE